MYSTCSYQLWEHGQSGEVFAVRLGPGGRVTGCCGPLLSNQIHPDALPAYPYDEDQKDLVWIEKHRDNWVPFEMQSPPHY